MAKTKGNGDHLIPNIVHMSLCMCICLCNLISSSIVLHKLTPPQHKSFMAYFVSNHKLAIEIGCG